MSDRNRLSESLGKIREKLGHEAGPVISDKEFIDGLMKDIVKVTPENEARIRELWHKYSEIVERYNQTNQDTQGHTIITPETEWNIDAYKMLDALMLKIMRKEKTK